MKTLRRVGTSLVALSLVIPPVRGVVPGDFDDRHFMSRQSPTFGVGFSLWGDLNFCDPYPSFSPWSFPFSSSFWGESIFSSSWNRLTLLPFDFSFAQVDSPFSLFNFYPFSLPFSEVISPFPSLFPSAPVYETPVISVRPQVTLSSAPKVKKDITSPPGPTDSNLEEQKKKQQEEELEKQRKEKEELDRKKKEDELLQKRLEESKREQEKKRQEREQERLRQKQLLDQEKENQKKPEKEEMPTSTPVPIKPKNRPLLEGVFGFQLENRGNSFPQENLSQQHKGLDLDRGSVGKKGSSLIASRVMDVSNTSTFAALSLDSCGTVRGSKSFRMISGANKEEIERRKSVPLFKDNSEDFKRICEQLGKKCSKEGNPEFTTPEMTTFLFQKIGELNKIDLPIKKVISVRKIGAKSFVGETYIIKVVWGQENEEKVIILKYLVGEVSIDHPIANWTRPELEVKNVQDLWDFEKEGILKQAGFVFKIPFQVGEYYFKAKGLGGSSKKILGASETRKLFTVQFAADGKSVTEIVNEAFCDEKKKETTKSQKKSGSKNVSQHTAQTKLSPQRSAEEESVCEMFRAIGKAIAEMQLGNNPVFPDLKEYDDPCKFYDAVRVLAFNDMHPDNIFWDLIKRVASLIDIETLAYGFGEDKKPRGLMLYDIFYFIQQTHKRFQPPALNKMRDLRWSMYKDLIDGYISVYQEKGHSNVGAFVESSMRNSGRVKFKDHHNIFGLKVSLGKAPDDSISKEIIETLREHLAQYKKN